MRRKRRLNLEVSLELFRLMVILLDNLHRNRVNAAEFPDRGKPPFESPLLTLRKPELPAKAG
jgi:hypothetical protein